MLLRQLLLSIGCVSWVTSATLEERVQALEEQNSVLAEELLAEQSGGFTLVDTQKSYNGLGPAASKVYFSKNPLSIGGYGEMYYADPNNGDDYADVYRFVTYIGYKFSDRVILNTEIEFEHGANPEDGGEVVLEFMYLDFLGSEYVNGRVGHLLVPMGIVGLRHEPILFTTVQRPETETYLIPTTWHENGALLYGQSSRAGLSYTLGIVNALNVNANATKTANPSWIRGARQGATAKAAFKPAFVGRLDYTGINGLLVGASLYYGNGSNIKNGLDNHGDTQTDVSGVTTTMFDLHATYEHGPFKAYGLYAQTRIDGAEKLGAGAVEQAEGYYINMSYDMDAWIDWGYRMPMFVQYESYNPVAKTVDGNNEHRYDTQITTIGMNFYPVDQAVLKADFAVKKVNGRNENTISLGLGFVF